MPPPSLMTGKWGNNSSHYSTTIALFWCRYIQVRYHLWLYWIIAVCNAFLYSFLFSFFTGPSPMNHHLVAVERFACPNEPGRCVVWCLVLLVGSPMANWSLGRGQTKNGSRRPMEDEDEALVRSEPLRSFQSIQGGKIKAVGMPCSQVSIKYQLFL